jgi:hypothetical protein
MVSISTASNKAYQFHLGPLMEFVAVPGITRNDPAVAFDDDGTIGKAKKTDKIAKMCPGGDFFFRAVADDPHQILIVPGAGRKREREKTYSTRETAPLVELFRSGAIAQLLAAGARQRGKKKPA